MNVIKKICVLFAMLFLLMQAALFAEDQKVMEAEGTAFLGDDLTMAQGKAAALNNARRSALEKATGVMVHGASVVYNNQLINDLVMAATRGIIVKEQVLENKCQTSNEHISCAAKIIATVKPLNYEKRGTFKVEKTTVQRPDNAAAPKNAVFQSRDEIQIRTSVNQDAYVSIFSVDQYGNVARLYPNEYCGLEKQPAEKALVFPDEAQRKMGLKLKVRTPKGVKTAVESVLVIATKEKAKLLTDTDIENPTITDLMAELSKLDASIWVEDTAGYEVRE